MPGKLIVLGDSTSHGGQVLQASVETKINGKGVARVGDQVSCPIKGHGTCAIVTGDATCLVDGKPVAREGDQTACGAKLIPTQALTTNAC